jgi:acyl-coenzyme A thioesterase PaaI-like protein
VISACFDVALGLAAFSTMEPWDVCSTVELKVNYLKPIHLGDKLTFKSGVDFEGKRLRVVHGYVYKNGEKTPTGMASGTYYVISTRK